MRDLTYTILAVQDRRRDWKNCLRVAWDAVAMWRELMPTKNHMPAPTVLVHALVTLAMLWSWPSIAALVALGFTALFRPGEIAALRVRNFVFAISGLRFSSRSAFLVVSGEIRGVFAEFKD